MFLKQYIFHGSLQFEIGWRSDTYSGEIQLQVKVDQADIFFLSVSSMKFVMALPLISQRPSTAID